MRYAHLLLLMVLPLAFAWVFPHDARVSSDVYSDVRLCATVYSGLNTTLTLVCGNDVVGERNVIANVPTIACFTYRTGLSSVSCVWRAGMEEEVTYVDVFPHRAVDSLLALLLIVLVLRFSVKTVKTLIGW